MGLLDKLTNIVSNTITEATKSNTKKVPYPYKDMESYQMAKRRDNYIYTLQYQKIENQYYDSITKIDTLWSVLYNLKDFNGEKADKFEQICIDNINVFKKMYYDYWVPNNTHDLNCVPAYKRLAMLYEKQGRYDDAVRVCIDAIDHGAPNEYGDGGSGKLYARLARMAKKAGLLEDDKIQYILRENQ